MHSSSQFAPSGGLWSWLPSLWWTVSWRTLFALNSRGRSARRPRERSSARARGSSSWLSLMLNSSVPGGGVKHDNYLERFLKARVYDVASETPLELAPGLSRRLRNRLLIKREDLQPVFSFKLRGAYNKMAGLPRARLARGVIAASAGNHAQGVALAAQRLGCRAVIVMPVTTPRIKVDAVLARGAQVVLHGDSYAEAFAQAMRLKRRRGLAFVHPYDDPEVIAGQGTIGMEILRQHAGPLDAIFVPVGGGGLISGIAAYVKRVRPSIRVVGVEPVDAAAMTQSLKKGRRVKLEHVGLFADGVAVKQVGRETFRLCRELVDEVVLAVTIPERPGSFKKFCAQIGARSVTEFNYRIADSSDAHIFVGVEVHGSEETARIVRNLRRHGLTTLDLSDNELAKWHVRHMVGGRAPFATEELLYRFEFPERPGALMRFLSSMRSDWNISLFHYRNHGADYGRVLVGMQVPSREMKQFRQFLENLGYPYAEETRNPAYRLFLV